MFKGIFSISFLLQLVLASASAQCPNVLFNIQDSVCLGESLNLKNNTIGAASYNWTFCDDNLKYLSGNTKISTNDAFRAAYAACMIQESEAYLLTLRNNGILYRTALSADLNSVVGISAYPSQSTFFSSPRDIRIKMSIGNYVGIVSNIGKGLSRLNFGNSIQNNPLIDNLTGISAITGTNGLEIVNDNGTNIVLVGKETTNQIFVLNFGDDLMNSTPTVSEIVVPNATGIQGISLINQCGTWHGLVTSYSNSKIFRLIFENGLFSKPVVEEIVINNADFINPAKTAITVENGQYFGFVQCNNGFAFRLEFGSSMTSAPAISSLSALSTNGYYIGLMNQGSLWKAFSIDYNNLTRGLVRVDFDNNCTIIPENSAEFEPEDVIFNTPGLFPVTLVAYDESGLHFSSKRTYVKVRDETVPDFDIDIEDNRCVINTISLNGKDETNTITQWNWDLGDGSLKEGKEINHKYQNQGSYEIFLSVEAINNCSNTRRKRITLFDPPVSSFIVEQNSICSNANITFTNESILHGADEYVSWLWQFTELDSSEEKNAGFTFRNGGVYPITLTASIPGCSDDTTVVIDVVDGPKTEFNWSGACEGEDFVFENGTTGENITSWAWDFGDGYTSSVQAPIHRFAGAGSFEVSLRAENEAGCANTLSKNLYAGYLPRAAFYSELACANNAVQFYDNSTVPEANILNWAWKLDYLDGVLESRLSAEQNPAIFLPAAGRWRGKLMVASDYGCRDSVEQIVEALPAPLADFSIENQCLGTPTLFKDRSTGGNGYIITGYDWLLEGLLLSGPEQSYSYGSAGQKEVTLIVRADNLCRSTVTKSFPIHRTPTASFTNSRLCANDLVTFSSSSNPNGEVISSYRWTIGGNPVSFGPEFKYKFGSAGTWPVALRIETDKGCSHTSTRNIATIPTPVARFTASPDRGAPPLQVSFANQSTGATAYEWTFEPGATSTAVNPSHTYNNMGTARPRLVAVNSSGCSDTAWVSIQIITEEYDLALGDLRTVAGPDGRSRLLVTVQNRGSVTVEGFELRIVLNDGITLVEWVSRPILPGQSYVHEVGFDLVQQARERVALACLSVPREYGLLADLDPQNNEACLSLSDTWQVLEPWPNPASDVIHIPIVLPSAGTVRLRMVSSRGGTLLSRDFANLSAGLTYLNLELAPYPSGVYMLNVEFGNEREVRKIVIQ